MSGGYFGFVRGLGFFLLDSGWFEGRGGDVEFRDFLKV